MGLAEFGFGRNVFIGIALVAPLFRSDVRPVYGGPKLAPLSANRPVGRHIARNNPGSAHLIETPYADKSRD